MRQMPGFTVVLFRRGLVDGGDWRLISGSAAALEPRRQHHSLITTFH
jgi:hypothetical protein